MAAASNTSSRFSRSLRCTCSPPWQGQRRTGQARARRRQPRQTGSCRFPGRPKTRRSVPMTGPTEIPTGRRPFRCCGSAQRVLRDDGAGHRRERGRPSLGGVELDGRVGRLVRSRVGEPPRGGHGRCGWRFRLPVRVAPATAGVRAGRCERRTRWTTRRRPLDRRWHEILAMPGREVP